MRSIRTRGSGEDVDVMLTVDALKTTNKELKKQYGKINLDKSKQGPCCSPPLDVHMSLPGEDIPELG